MKKGMERKRLKAPAKLNFGLRVLGRRQDGYHELETVMVPVALYDEIDLEITGCGVKVSGEGFEVPDDEGNLVGRAAKEFFRAARVEGGITARIRKRIPVAAGLGGGSSDAACTLKALNDMYGRPLATGALETVALCVGADVPFFLKGGPCLAGGIGEILKPVKNWPELWYVIVTPPIHVSTARVYGSLKSPPVEAQNPDTGEFRLTEKALGYIIAHLEQRPFNIGDFLENDLEPVTTSDFPVILEIKKALIEAGAEGALMSGSGPSVFGVFTSREDALRGKKPLVLMDVGDVFLVRGLS